ncbi:RluA family pseudouridine synthase [Campylobacter novaezeelandiae]|uniref:RNA pseudouridylate synthase n=1 Tax=Campylobacter novaezeelandiae TaxID=2267891 RepID=A0A4Q9JWE6_9BACT|nr:RluA family pseudouridine synthase [Campylobacter novaezeelandiae]TBR79153.1 RluA family pseudouridine synthase [Campylobacter novaezeelandiae]TBR81029.1 RluA family pseudouridine synthase [Campylobacter novaezeelandiae]TBR81874.1 RluA family pseudouridine synthase [Campylobacter novaezeelandiae]TBR82086.1 RluA family pseudouridine synthase [Campylobacter novaezeelandiae]
MPYTKIKLSNNGKKAFQVLMENLKISINEAQKLIDKKRLFCDGNLVTQKNQILKGIIELIVYENNPKGVEIVFENEDFSVIEKPSGVLSHPNGRNCEYSLCDEIWHIWGKEACVAHRLDKETSGLILVAKHKNSQIDFKTMFEKKEIQKEYLALVQGKINENFSVNVRMDLVKDYDDIKTRMCICEKGKNSFTEFEILEFYPEFNATLLLCKPFTGRQHQIRLHLFHVKHKILGDPLYGLNKEQIERILDKKMEEKERIEFCGAKRLLLHSYRLKFKYKNKFFDIISKKNIKKEFLNFL